MLMMSAKLATLGFLKVKTFWSKRYDVIISVYDVTDRVLSRDSDYMVDVIMLLSKSKKSSMSMAEVNNLNFIKIWPEKNIF